jgi:tetratricopeptide (TPR) repeat protein
LILAVRGYDCRESVVVVAGPGGVGKTTLAVRAAHLARRYFTDGQLYADLRGASRSPLSSGGVLARFLRSLGIQDQAIPADHDERAGLYRSVLADRRVLIVLDDARDAAHVAPLLPGAGSCAVVVTSRDRLADLDGAHRVGVDVLNPGEARDLLAGIVGDGRLSAEPRATDAVLSACAGLPLAIRIAAGRLISRPDLTLADLAELLVDRHRRLDALTVGGRAIRASFEVSYAALPSPVNAHDPDPAVAFRLLSLIDVTDFGISAAAALLGKARKYASEVVGQLVQANLLQTPHVGRYRYHDLLHVYASELTARHDSAETRADATQRALAWYVRAAAAAMDELHPYEKHRRPRLQPPTPPIEDGSARTWLETEQANLMAVSSHAAHHGHPQLTVDLSMTLWRHFANLGRHNDGLVLHRRALETARQNHDTYGEARASAAIGLSDWRLGRNREALDALERALALFRAEGDRVDESITLTNLGLVFWHLGRYRDAQAHYLSALAIAREAGELTSQANALGNLGIVHGRLGRYVDSVETLQAALTLQRRLGSAANECTILTSLGVVHGKLGRHAEALDFLGQSRDLARLTGNRTAEYESLRATASVHHRAGRIEQALENHHQLLAMSEDFESRDVDAIVLNGYALTLTALGRPGEAKKHHERALALSRQTGDQYQQALAIDGIGDALHQSGDAEQAREIWRDALARMDRLGVPEAADVRRKLVEPFPSASFVTPDGSVQM